MIGLARVLGKKVALARAISPKTNALRMEKPNIRALEMAIASAADHRKSDSARKVPIPPRTLAKQTRSNMADGMPL